MTSTTGTDEHPEVAEISALAEGVLPPDRSADVRGHLGDCALCADVRTSLDEIRGLLGTLPGPPRMPADIAGRIDAALAAEALLDSTAPTVPPAVSRETAAVNGVSRETAAGPSGRPPAATGPGRRPRARRRWSRTALATVCAAGALGLGGILVQSLSPGTDDTPTSAVEKADSAGDLQARVSELLVGTKASIPKYGVEASEQATLSSANDSVPLCVLQGIDRSETPLAADRGNYAGTDSYLVVLPHGTDTAHVDAYVVDASCAAAAPFAPGEVLRQDTYAR